MEKVRYWSYVVLDGKAHCIGHAHSYTRAVKILREVSNYGSSKEDSKEEAR